MKYNKIKRNYSLDTIRIIGALLIFLCHACLYDVSAIGIALSQFFNIGVPIFFMLSGYLLWAKKQF